MKLSAPRPLRHPVLAAAAALALIVSAGAAQAFTFQDQEGAANGGRGFKDLDIPKVPNDAPTSRFNDGQTVIKRGNSTFYFGARPGSNQNYNTENMFNPYYRDGRW